MTKQPLPIPMGEKTEEMRESIEALFPGTLEAIKTQHCPVYRKPITDFRDDLSRKEYGISGMCQSCQDAVWPPTKES